ncbi:MAG: CRP/FNR family cyclic AMP-dependent transcriptional regulator [Crocinitomix sp.]|jgi:CRP/FNR family cyclic AMP-dependent transcriptional regulator
MNNLAAYWFLENFDFMRKLGKSNLMKLCDILEMEQFRKGETIHYVKASENRVIFLKKGSVKIVDSVTNTVKYLVKEGNIFGELDIPEIGEQQRQGEEHSVCLEDVVVCYLTTAQMQGVMDNYPSLKNHVIKIQSFRIKKLERRLSDLLYKTSEERIFEFIISYVKEHGIKNAKSYSIKNKLTHLDIANLTNTSRQTVNNVISTLRTRGLIEYSRKLISIPDEPKA